MIFYVCQAKIIKSITIEGTSNSLFSHKY